MTLQERQLFWQQHIEAWQASSLSGAAFCKQQSLNYSQFNYWRKKYQDDSAEAVSAGFARVTHLPVSASDDGLSIHLPNGLRFTGVCADNLNTVLALLRQL